MCAARLVGENDQPVLVPTIEEGDNFWTTSHGRFRFTVDELPPELQLLYGLLNVSTRPYRHRRDSEMCRTLKGVFTKLCFSTVGYNIGTCFLNVPYYSRHC